MSIPVKQLDTTPALDREDGLVFEMYYAQCLAAGSYVVAHDGWAVVVDPLRDVDRYLSALTTAGAKLKAVLLTHAHADYVGGHAELAEKTGATIVAGQRAGMTFPHLRARDGDVITLSDKYRLRVMETPGHTLGCVSYVLESPSPLLAFTGDTLFVGSCGRPDLVGATVPAPVMAGTMFDSLQRLCALGDDLQIFPAHGAGSPCGKSLSDKLYSSIGHEKITNPALRIGDKESFVNWLVGSATMPTPPQYFGACVQDNLSGGAGDLQPLIDQVPLLDGAAFAAAAAGRLVLDTREAQDFLPAHLEGSIHLPLGTEGGMLLTVVDGNFAIWLGTLVTAAEIVVVTTKGKEQEVLARMARVGYVGRVKGLANDVSGCETVAVSRFAVEGADQVRSSGVQFVDVRTPQEFACVKKGRIAGAVSLPLQGTMEEYMSSASGLDPSQTYVCLCRGGFRSCAAASLLRKAGLKATDVFGGYALTIEPKLADMIVNKVAATA